MNKKWVGSFQFVLYVFLSSFVVSANAVTPEEINQKNYEAEQACEANRNYGPKSGNEILDIVSDSNWGFLWNLVKDEAKFKLCEQLTPKKLAKLLVNLTPDLADKINSISESEKTDSEKGKDLEVLIEEYMSTQYGYANNNKAYIKTAPILGMTRIGWEDDIHYERCPKWYVTKECVENEHGEFDCWYGGYWGEIYDSIYPDYDIYRVVNGVETYLATVEGAIQIREEIKINISFNSTETLLKSVGKDLVKKQVARLKEKDSSNPSVINTYSDFYANIYANSKVRYKLVGSDPGGARGCSDNTMDSFMYYIDYDMDADGIPDFVDNSWYSSQIGKLYAPILVPIINSILL